MKTFFFLLMLLLPSIVAAQSQSTDCGCNAALAKDLISIVSTSSETQQYAFLNVIDEKLFQEFKANGGLIVSIPIVDALVKASANYSEFEQRRREYFQKTEVNYSASKQQSYQQLQVVTNTVAYEYWAGCMNTCAKTKSDQIFAWKQQEDATSVILIVYWHGPAGASKALLGSSLEGGTVDGAQPKKLFPKDTFILSNGTASAIVKRIPGQTIKATVTTSGKTDAIWSTWNDATSTNSAKLILERPKLVETKIEDRCNTSGWTGSNSNKGCDHACARLMGSGRLHNWRSH